MICDNKIIEDVDTNNYISLPFSADLEGDFLKVNDLSNLIQYQVKSGTRSAIVTIKLDEENQMSVVDSMVGNFFDKNSDLFTDVEESNLDEKYTELVDDIGDFILENQNITSSVRKEIQSLLESEKATIITTVAEYVKAGEIEVQESNSHYYLKISGIELGILLAALMLQFSFAYLLGCGKIKGLRYDEEKLCESSDDWKVTPLKTLSKAREMYVRVDDIRQTKIKSLVQNELSEDSQKLFK